MAEDVAKAAAERRARILARGADRLNRITKSARPSSNAEEGTEVAELQVAGVCATGQSDAAGEDGKDSNESVLPKPFHVDPTEAIMRLVESVSANDSTEATEEKKTKPASSTGGTAPPASTSSSESAQSEKSPVSVPKDGFKEVGVPATDSIPAGATAAATEADERARSFAMSQFIHLCLVSAFAGWIIISMIAELLSNVRQSEHCTAQHKSSDGIRQCESSMVSQILAASVFSPNSSQLFVTFQLPKLVSAACYWSRSCGRRR
jgi:hypothetical protein